MISVYLSNAYPEGTLMIFSTTAGIRWQLGTKVTSHNIQMKLHNKIMSTFKTRRSRELVIFISLTMLLAKSVPNPGNPTLGFPSLKAEHTQKSVCLPYARPLGWNSCQGHPGSPSLAKRWQKVLAGTMIIQTVTEPSYIPGLVPWLGSIPSR